MLVSTLSRADQKLLNRLQIPQAQKLLFENYWQTKPAGRSKWSDFDWFLKLVRPAMIGALASPYFMSGTQPFINITLVVLWVLYPITIVIHASIAVLVSGSAALDKDETMDRIFAGFLPGAHGRIEGAYSRICWTAFFGLTAADGHLFTSAMIAFCWIGTWLLNKFCQGSMEEFLRQRIVLGPVVRIIRTVGMRIEE